MADELGSMKSYTSVSGGLVGIVRDGLQLLRAHHTGGVKGQVEGIVNRLRDLEEELQREYDFSLAGKRILDVGAGQRLNQLAFFTLRGDAVGIDSDVIVQGLDVAGYLRMLRLNGGVRTAKTIARKLLQVDRQYRRELARQLGVPRIPPMQVRQMDAERLDFPSASFDFVYSQSVFSHLHAPERVLGEIDRVLKPSGVVYIDFLLYTARTGCMDVRVLGGRDAEVPLWAHLRPAHQSLVRESAYLNKIRLPHWKALFAQMLPNARVQLHKPDESWLTDEAERLQAAGELSDYSQDELVTSYLTVTWQKPGVAAASRAETVTSS